MRFLVEDFCAFLCFLDGFGIAVPVFSYLETSNSVINCKATAPDCGLPSGAKLSQSMNYCQCSARFSKSKMLYFLLEFCVFKYTNSTCVHNNIFRFCIIISQGNLCHNIEERKLFKLIPNIIRFINR